jgi:hypothetical protein
MGWLLAALLVLSPALLYGLLLVFAALHRGRCAACGQRGLKCVGATLATVVVNGRRAPDSWSYYACDKCGAAFKLHCDQWTRVPAEEAQGH